MGRLSDAINRGGGNRPAVKAINEKELKLAILKIRALGDVVSKRQQKQILRKGAGIIRDAAKANVPIAAEPYTVYKGGKPFASVMPGFVRDAIQVRSLPRSYALWVGIAKVNTILAYWAKWLEFGAAQYPGFAFMRRALESTKDQAIAQIVSDAKRLFDRKIAQLKKG